VLAVHAVWSAADRLLLWAEDAARAGDPAPRRPGRRPRVLPHPYAATPEETVDHLGEVAAKAAAGTVALRLPTRGGRPVPSPELPYPATTQHGGAEPAAGWSVPVLESEPDSALEILPTIAGRDDLTLGATVRYLAALAEFSVDLVRRGRLVPTVAPTPSGPVASWRPVLTGEDAAWARALALASPPALRADAPPRAAAEVVAGAIDTLVDAAARAALGPRLRSRGSTDLGTALLAALTGRDPGLRADPPAVDALRSELAAWHRDVVGGPARACFRLVEPDDAHPDAPWRLEFALQAADEPSLLVEADQIWHSRGAVRALARHVPAPQEALLAELGRARRLYPRLDAALRAARPSTMDLDVAAAHEFLAGAAPLLAGAGFGVLLPSWWHRPSARLGVRLTASTPAAPGIVSKATGLGQQAIVDYQWQVALGGHELTASELADLTKLKAPLVRLRGQWVQVDQKRLAAGLKLLQAGGSGQLTVGELLQVTGGLDGEQASLPVTDVVATGWLGDLLSGTAPRRLRPVAAPPGFAGTLRPYQKRGLAWLHFLQQLGLGGILADDMGLGKTVQLLALFAGDPGDSGPTLLVCPMSLVGNWQREAARFAPGLAVHVHHGAERPRGRKFTAAVRAADLVLTTYAIAARDAAELSTIDWHRVVLDEAQAVKNAATRQAVAVRALPARHRVAVTGTPVENRLADLWSLMDFANPGLLGTAASFKRRYAEPVERQGDAEAAARLRRVTQPLVLRRVKTDRSVIRDLPDKLEMEVLCNLTAEQASLYQAVVQDMLARIDSSEGIERRGLVLATMTKLKQVCNHPAQLLRDGSRLAGRSGKLARLEEILEEVLAAGEKALLFTQYAEFGGMLRAHLSARFAREVLLLHGASGKAERDAMVARFQDAGGPALFVLSLKAGGTGLTLTAANHVVHVDRWWNPAVEDQATDRAYRIGQRRAVQVRKFVCAGTVEEKVSGMIRDKRGLAARIVGTGEQWLTELSTVELQALFALEAGAVVE
jgi:hypothetical protein